MNDINEKIIIDKGWKQMSNLLDKEMPVANKYKNQKKYALILLLLLISFATGYYFIDQGHKQGSGKIDVLKKTQSPKTPTSNTKNNFASIGIIDKESTNFNKNNTNRSNEDNGAISKIHITNKNKLSKKNIVERIEVARNHYNQNTRESDSFDKTNIYNQVLHKSDAKNKLISGRNLNDIVLVPVLKNKYINQLSNDFELFYTKPVISGTIDLTKKAIFNNYFIAGISVVSENIQSFGGAESCFSYNVDLSRKIGINAGVDFSFFRKRGMTYSFLTNIFNIPPYDGRYESKKVERPNGITSRYNEDFNISTRNPYALAGFIDKLYYMGLPVSIYYKNKKYRVSLGMRTSYLLKGTNFTANKNYVGGQNYVIHSDRAFINSKVYNRLGYSTFISYEYSIWRNFSISSKFNYSFTNILRSPKEQLSNDNISIFLPITNEEYKNRYDKNIYFSLGLTYKL